MNVKLINLEDIIFGERKNNLDIDLNGDELFEFNGNKVPTQAYREMVEFVTNIFEQIGIDREFKVQHSFLISDDNKEYKAILSFNLNRSMESFVNNSNYLKVLTSTEFNDLFMYAINNIGLYPKNNWKLEEEESTAQTPVIGDGDHLIQLSFTIKKKSEVSKKEVDKNEE